MPTRKGTQKLEQSLQRARRRIEQLFIDQCSNGAQTTNLASETVAACGQLIGPDAGELGQRGLHGTAAAMKVLSQADDERARQLVPRLAKYAAERTVVEQRCRGADETAKALAQYKCDLDAHNVIKLSELLEALACAQQGAVDVRAVVSTVGACLKESFRDGKGWYYFTGEQRSPELLPTAYAVIGLSAVGMYEEASPGERFLRDELLRFYESSGTQFTDSETRAIHIACLYAAVFRKRPDGDRGRDDLDKVFQALWRRCKREMDHDDEQNVEYWREMSKTCYVRIPWQLYLLALAGYFGFKWHFSTSTSQALLNRAICAARADGFIYPHSGQRPSARTNAVLHEVLGYFAGLLRDRDLGIGPRVAEVVGSAARSRIARLVYIGLAILVIAYSLYSAHRASSAMWPQLAPGFVGAVVMLLLSSGVRGLKGQRRR